MNNYIQASITLDAPGGITATSTIHGVHATLYHGTDGLLGNVTLTLSDAVARELVVQLTAALAERVAA